MLIDCIYKIVSPHDSVGDFNALILPNAYIDKLLKVKHMITTIRYQLSAKTKLKDNILKENILSKLREFGYDSVSFKENTIYFGLQGWGLMGNQVGKANGGTVQYTEFENEKIVILTYHVNLIFNLLLLICFIFSIFLFSWIALVLVTGVILFTFLDLDIIKTRHKDLLNQFIDNVAKSN